MKKKKPLLEFKALFLFPLIFLFLSCGYNLRTSIDLNQDFNYSVLYSENYLNNKLIDSLRLSNPNKTYLNDIREDSEVIIKIINHSLTRYSAALGSGARTKEARLEYLLEISLKLRSSNKEMEYQIRNSKNYSFNESNILSIEQEEEQITTDFINFSLNKIKLLSSRLK